MVESGSPPIDETAYNEHIDKLPLPLLIREELAFPGWEKWIRIHVPPTLEGTLEGQALVAVDRWLEKMWTKEHVCPPPNGAAYKQMVDKIPLPKVFRDLLARVH